MNTTTRIELQARFFKNGNIVHQAAGFSREELDTVVLPNVRRNHGAGIRMETRQVITVTIDGEWS